MREESVVRVCGVGGVLVRCAGSVVGIGMGVGSQFLTTVSAYVGA